eukprot:Nk52_evm5s598 gene=Nk52_evmTU5s598
MSGKDEQASSKGFFKSVREKRKITSKDLAVDLNDLEGSLCKNWPYPFLKRNVRKAVSVERRSKKMKYVSHRTSCRHSLCENSVTVLYRPDRPSQGSFVQRKSVHPEHLDLLLSGENGCLHGVIAVVDAEEEEVLATAHREEDGGYRPEPSIALEDGKSVGWALASKKTTGEQQEKELIAQEKERAAAEQRERERIALEKERAAAEKRERERIAQEKERAAAEQRERERIAKEKERAAAEQRERERIAKEKERAAAEQRESVRELIRERIVQEKEMAATERRKRELIAQEKERAAAEQCEKERIAQEKENTAAERRERERVAQEKEHSTAEKPEGRENEIGRIVSSRATATQRQMNEDKDCEIVSSVRKKLNLYFQPCMVCKKKLGRHVCPKCLDFIVCEKKCLEKGQARHNGICFIKDLVKYLERRILNLIEVLEENYFRYCEIWCSDERCETKEALSRELGDKEGRMDVAVLKEFERLESNIERKYNLQLSVPSYKSLATLANELLKNVPKQEGISEIDAKRRQWNDAKPSLLTALSKTQWVRVKKDRPAPVLTPTFSAFPNSTEAQHASVSLPMTVPVNSVPVNMSNLNMTSLNWTGPQQPLANTVNTQSFSLNSTNQLLPSLPLTTILQHLNPQLPNALQRPFNVTSNMPLALNSNAGFPVTDSTVPVSDSHMPFQQTYSGPVLPTTNSASGSSGNNDVQNSLYLQSDPFRSENQSNPPL